MPKKETQDRKGVYEDEFDREEALLKKEKKQQAMQKLLAMLPAPLLKLLKKDAALAEASKARAEALRQKRKSALLSSIQPVSEDLVFEVDAQNNRVSVWRAPHRSHKHTQIETFECQFASMEDNDFRDRFLHILMNYLASNPPKKTTAVYVILPDSAVAMDLIGLPRMKRSVMGDAVKAEAKLLYRNNKELQMRYSMLSADKQSVLFNVTMMRMAVQSYFYESFNAQKLYPRAVCNAAVATLNAALVLRAKLHNKNFVFLDVKENYSRLIFCSKNHCCGYTTLAVGYSSLYSDRVVFEPELYDHSVAELAVLNAEEAAKAKMLTVSGDESASPIDGTDAEMPAESFLDSVSNAMGQENANAAGGGKTPKVFTKAAPKKHPKFMQREVPETPEGILYENFRVFEKWTLLFVRSCTQMTPSAKPDFVMLNIPAQYAGVIQTVNESGAENGIRFRYFAPDHEQDPDLTENLELFGVTASDKYNKDLNF